MDNEKISNTLSRRSFVNVVTIILGSIMGVVIGLPGIGYLISPAIRGQKSEAWIPLGPMENYALGIPTLFIFTRTNTNGWEKTVNSYGVYVLRKDDQVIVLSNICTHLGCRVRWHPDIQEYVSPCHDGHFDSEGKVTKGPPPRPLDHYETRVVDGILQIHLLSV